jgi:hypothetical protein
MPPPRPNAGLTPVNIDYVWGFSDTEAQHWMPPGPTLLYVPVHFLLRRLMPKPMRAWWAPDTALHRCRYWHLADIPTALPNVRFRG